MSKGKLNLDDSTEALEAELRAKEEVAKGELPELDEETVPVPSSTEGEDPETLLALQLLAAQGCTAEDIAQAREKFGKIYIYPWNQESIYVFRALNRKEYTLLKRLSEDEETFSNRVLQKGCIFPPMSEERKDSLPAGNIDRLLELIMRASGFVQLQEALMSVKEL